MFCVDWKNIESPCFAPFHNIVCRLQRIKSAFLRRKWVFTWGARIDGAQDRHSCTLEDQSKHHCPLDDHKVEEKTNSTIAPVRIRRPEPYFLRNKGGFLRPLLGTLLLELSSQTMLNRWYENAFIARKPAPSIVSYWPHKSLKVEQCYN